MPARPLRRTPCPASARQWVKPSLRLGQLKVESGKWKVVSRLRPRQMTREWGTENGEWRHWKVGEPFQLFNPSSLQLRCRRPRQPFQRRRCPPPRPTSPLSSLHFPLRRRRRSRQARPSQRRRCPPPRPTSPLSTLHFSLRRRRRPRQARPSQCQRLPLRLV